MRSRRPLVAAAAAVLLAGAVVAAVALLHGSTPEPRSAPVGVTAAQTLLRGIPQQGERLGSARAPVTLVEFADLQCPYCARWAATGLPAIVRDYVRPGKVRLVFAGLAFVGPDSATALRAALAAGRQNRLWNVLDLLYANQGTENAGWVTEPFLRSIGSAVPGLDVQRMLDDRGSTAVQQRLESAAALAQRASVRGTPAFAVGKTGGPLTLVEEPAKLAASLDAALAS